MKKVLYLAFAVLLLSVMCFNVMPARAEVTFNGEWRVRGYMYDIDGRNDPGGSRSDTASYWDQRFRLYLTAKVSDNLKGVIRMLAPNHQSCDYDSAGNIWGSGDAVNPKPVLWDIAYLDFDFSVQQTQLNIKLGRQGIDLGNMILLGSCKTYDSMILSSAIQNVKVSLLTVKLDEGNFLSGPFDDEDLYGAVLNFDPAPNMNLGIWAVMGKDGDTVNSGYILGDPTLNLWGTPITNNPSADAFWFGAKADMDFTPLKINLEFDYSKVTLNGEAANPDIEIKGYAFFGDVSADLPAVKVGGNVLYTTGDDKDDSNVYESDMFVPISSHFSERNDYDYMVIRRFLYDGGMVGSDKLVMFGGDRSIDNLIAIKLYAMKDLAPKLTGMLSVQNYSFTQDPDGPGPYGKNLGFEIDGKLVYQLYNNLTLTGVAAWWITDEDTFGPDNKDNWLLKHEVLYKF